MLLFKLKRTETRPNLETEFYSYTEEDNEVFSAMPYFIAKTETLSEDGLDLNKVWTYDFEYSNMNELLYHNESLNNLNIKVAQYCNTNNITRGDLNAYFEDSNGEVFIKKFDSKN